MLSKSHFYYQIRYGRASFDTETFKTKSEARDHYGMEMSSKLLNDKDRKYWKDKKAVVEMVVESSFEVEMLNKGLPEALGD
jgi:hypothetical protein